MTTESDVLAFLNAHPDFFERHPTALADLHIPHEQSGGVSSLLERQVLVLRERQKALESRVAEMVRHAQENDAIQDRLMTWLRDLLLIDSLIERANRLADSLSSAFTIPQVKVAIWSQWPSAQEAPWCVSETSTLKDVVTGLLRPMCLSAQSEQAKVVLRALAMPLGAEGSLALLPLRNGASPQAFGLMVFASPDAGRFTASHGTAFLERIAEQASAALGRLGSPDLNRA